MRETKNDSNRRMMLNLSILTESGKVEVRDREVGGKGVHFL